MYHLFFKNSVQNLIWNQTAKKPEKVIFNLGSRMKKLFFSGNPTYDGISDLSLELHYIGMKWSLWRGNRSGSSSSNNEALKETQKHLALESPLCQVPFRNGKIELLVSKASIQMHI